MPTDQPVQQTIMMLERQLAQLKKKLHVWEWKDADKEKPDYNVAVLVYIPDEDDHMTAGMIEVNGSWTLLDEYRKPDCPVTAWAKLPPIPKYKARP